MATKLDHNVISFDKHQILDAVVMLVHFSGKAEPIGLGAAELLLKHSLTTTTEAVHPHQVFISTDLLTLKGQYGFANFKLQYI